VNPFRSADALAADITRATGLRFTARRDLYSSFEYLNRYYFPARTSWRLRVLGNGHRRSIMFWGYATRWFDRIFRTRTSAYGWALYFGEIGEEVYVGPCSNVCVECGAGHVAAWLQALNIVHRRMLFFRSYPCPNCGAQNLFTPDG
jgi:hypothetical protein